MTSETIFYERSSIDENLKVFKSLALKQLRKISDKTKWAIEKDPQISIGVKKDLVKFKKEKKASDTKFQCELKRPV